MLAGIHVYDDGKANLLGACHLTDKSCLCWVASLCCLAAAAHEITATLDLSAGAP